MEENKENELKEVLGKTFSQQDIEKKLKQKIEAASQNRERFNKNKNLGENPSTTKKAPIKKLNFNFLLLILLVLMTVLIFIAIYLFNNQKNTLKINSNEESKTLFEKLYNSQNYDTYKCYAFEKGKISFPINSCKEQLDKFLAKNKNANRFEIVPLISSSDSILYKNVEKDLSLQPQKFQDKIKEYLNIGLATERVLESVWYIKKTLGENTIVTSSQYYVKSNKEEEQGVIIRAYH